MLRIISCFDIKNNFVVKGINFKNLKKINNPLILLLKYEKYNIDEIVLLDITSNYNKKSLSKNIIKVISKKTTKPISIGGGIKTENEIYKLLNKGADRIVLNTICYKNVNFTKIIAKKYGSQSIIVAIDVKIKKKFFYTYKTSGYIKSNFLLIDWIIIKKKFGSGEFLVTSINNDGTCKGYNLFLYFYLKNKTNFSIIVSGGMGSINDIFYIKKYCNIDTFLIASLFHNSFILPHYIKKYDLIYL